MAATEEALLLHAVADEPEYTFRAVLEGLSPLLMSHPRGMTPEEDDGSMKSSRTKKKQPTPEEEAEGRVYRDVFGALYVPVLAVNRAMVEAGKLFKDPRSPRGMSSFKTSGALTGGVFMPDYEGYVITRDGEPVDTYDVDTRRVVNKATKGAILSSRPKVALPWTLNVEFTADPTMILPNEIATILGAAGKKIGILAFRPEKLGPFGRFRVADYGTEGFDV